MNLKSLVKYFLVWQVLILVVVMAAGNILPLRRSDIYLGGGIGSYLKNPLLNFRANYDGIYYALIATQGYSHGQQAFFPLYPRLISLFRKQIDDPILIGTLISSASFLAGLFVLGKLIRLDYPARTAKWTIIALLVFPTSFFFSAVYTEGLFLLLAVLSFYFARTGRPWLACLSAALAGYTRLIGIFLLPALFIEFLSQSREDPFSRRLVRLVPLLIIPLGLIIYMYYLYRTTGDPILFYSLQSAFKQGRDTSIILPYQVLWRYVKMVLTVNRADPLYFTVWLEFVTGIIFLILSVISLVRQRLSYAVFNILAFILPTLTGIFTSLPRYVLICFPAFILIGELISGHKILRRMVITVFGIFWIVFLSLFARGYWVA